MYFRFYLFKTRLSFLMYRKSSITLPGGGAYLISETPEEGLTGSLLERRGLVTKSNDTDIRGKSDKSFHF